MSEQLTATEGYPADSELPQRPRRPLVTPLTGALAAVIVAGGGFFAGVEVQKRHGSNASSSANASARLPGGANGARFAPPGGGARPTFGTVSSANGDLLYVKDQSGTLLKVRTTSATKVSRTASSSAGGIHPGDTVIVQGSTKNGTITATRVSATQAGVSGLLGAGGFRGAGRFPAGGQTQGAPPSQP